jgi:phospholipase/carboxylesterase
MKLISLIAILFSVMFNATAQEIKSSNTATIDIQYVVRQSRKAIEHPPVLFLFHGASSNEHDLFSFADQVPDEWLVVSARAPYTVSDGHYRWYDVKLVDGKITIDFVQAQETQKRVLKFIDEIVSLYHADSKRVVLAGFSQGANMASLVSLTTPEKVSGFAVFSGRFIEEVKPFISTSSLLISLQCFLAHGNKDHMLPIAYAKENQQILQNLGISITYSEDAVAHSISPKQLHDFLMWLKQF